MWIKSVFAQLFNKIFDQNIHHMVKNLITALHLLGIRRRCVVVLVGFSLCLMSVLMPKVTNLLESDNSVVGAPGVTLPELHRPKSILIDTPRSQNA